MAEAIHFAEEMTGRFRQERPALPGIAISDAGHMSCIANDMGYQHVFSRFIEGNARAVMYFFAFQQVARAVIS